jgi:5-methylcytosine-specific restriction endonuclease McrA
MGKWIDRKQESTNIRGICVSCKKNPQKKATKTTYRPICSFCCKKKYEPDIFQKRKEGIKRHKRNILRPYRKYVKSECSFCGFIPVHISQLDVDHIDGNHFNNNPVNLQTLCANCHRLKTHMERLK